MSELALFGGTPLVTNHAELRVDWPLTDEKDWQAIQRVYENKDFSGRGSKEVTNLEEAFSRKFDGMHATALSSGTAGLHAALVAVGVEPGDEVIVPNLTFVATAVAALHCLAVPVFTDINTDDYNMSPDDLRQKITPRTKAVIVVHMHGFAARIAEIKSICDEHNIPLIEDVAQSPGATYEGKLLGTFGDAAVFSMMSQKNLGTCGEAGMLLTRTREQKNKAEMLRIYGEIIAEDGTRIYNSYSLGWNYTLNPMQAAMALTQLEKFDDLTKRIQEKGRQLTEGLRKFSWLQVPEEVANTTGVFHFYRIRLTPDMPKEEIRKFRRAVQDALNAEGANVRHYQNVPLSGQIIFKDRQAYGKDLPWALNDHEVEYDIHAFPGTLDTIRNTLVLGAISSFPGYLLKEGTVEKYIEAFEKLNDNLQKIMEYAKDVEYTEPWEDIPVTSDSFRATYGVLGNNSTQKKK